MLEMGVVDATSSCSTLSFTARNTTSKSSEVVCCIYLFGKSFRNVHAPQRNQALVLSVELRVVLVDKFNQLIPVDQLQIALRECEIPCALIKPSSRDKQAEILLRYFARELGDSRLINVSLPTLHLHDNRGRSDSQIIFMCHDVDPTIRTRFADL